jgi:hypothetical protein
MRTALHVSQKVFWFCVSGCLVLTTGILIWAIIVGRPVAVSAGNIGVTIQKAEQSVGDARDRLLAIRTRLNIASEEANLDGVNDALPELDEILKSLGVAQAALQRQQARLYDGGGFDVYGTDYTYGPTPPEQTVISNATSPIPKRSTPAPAP